MKMIKLQNKKDYKNKMQKFRKSQKKENKQPTGMEQKILNKIIHKKI